MIDAKYTFQTLYQTLYQLRKALIYTMVLGFGGLSLLYCSN